MTSLNILFLLVSSLIILFVYISQNKNKTIDKLNHKVEHKKSNLELLQQYIEECIIDCGIDLNNVYVYSGTLDTTYDGLCFNIIEEHKSNKIGLKHLYFKKGEYYLIIPEVTDYITAKTTLHEIAHYLYKHSKTNLDTFEKEYEADLYAIKILDKFYDLYLNEKQDKHTESYEYKIHKLEIEIVQIHQSYNIIHYINKENFKKIPKYIIDFISEKAFNEHVMKFC